MRQQDMLGDGIAGLQSPSALGSAQVITAQASNYSGVVSPLTAAFMMARDFTDSTKNRSSIVD